MMITMMMMMSNYSHQFPLPFLLPSILVPFITNVHEKFALHRQDLILASIRAWINKLSKLPTKIASAKLIDIMYDEPLSLFLCSSFTFQQYVTMLNPLKFQEEISLHEATCINQHRWTQVLAVIVGYHRCGVSTGIGHAILPPVAVFFCTSPDIFLRSNRNVP